MPFSSSCAWASAVKASDGISSARTMSGLDLVGDSSNHASSISIYKKLR
ncbi:MAG TPA: hypothetical protein PLM24_09400 [Methanothrix sp.]|nr:hypothetical protein [Methanothrix sp.]HPR67334.1 hypothetical protein [Methanothrix sp.]